MPDDAAPYITRELVEQTLSEFGYTTEAQVNPLHHLLIVDVFLASLDVRLAEDARIFALGEIVAVLIERQFFGHRRLHNIPTPVESWRIDDYKTYIHHDMRTKNAELLAWSILFHHDLHPELGLTKTEYSHWVSVSERTFKRYRDYAIRRLTHTLILEESTAWTQHRRRGLLTKLPANAPQHLIGRDVLLSETIDVLDQHEPHHVLITGANGVGKTMFTLALTRRLIDHQPLGNIIWLDSPPSCDYVRTVLYEHLVPEQSLLSLRDALLLLPNTLLVVIDQCDALLKNLDEFELLLKTCDQALLILTSRLRVTSIDMLLCVSLPELNEEYALEVVKRAAPIEDGLRISDDEARDIVVRVGGNPRALLMACQQLSAFSWHAIQQHIHGSLYQELFNGLSDNARLTWVAIALAALQTAALTDLKRWLHRDVESAITDLRHTHILDATINDDETYVMAHGAAGYVIGEWGQGGKVDNTLNVLIASLNTDVYVRSTAILPFIQHLLTVHSDKLANNQRYEWCEHLASEGIRAGYATVWKLILEAIPDLTRWVSLHLAYCACLRRLGEWDAAELQLEHRLHNDSVANGSNGHAETLIEIAILSRYRGRYELAYALLQRADNAARRAPHLRPQIAFEQARIALDRNRPHEIPSLLNDQEETPERNLLLAEAYLLIDKWARCQLLLEVCLNTPTVSPGQLASAHMLLGRMYDQLGDYARARRHCVLSLINAEKSGDVLTLARARSNLGAIYIHLGQYAKASRSLKQAQAALHILKDRVGLIVVEQNLRLLQTQVAR